MKTTRQKLREAMRAMDEATKEKVALWEEHVKQEEKEEQKKMAATLEEAYTEAEAKELYARRLKELVDSGAIKPAKAIERLKKAMEVPVYPPVSGAASSGSFSGPYAFDTASVYGSYTGSTSVPPKCETTIEASKSPTVMDLQSKLNGPEVYIVTKEKCIEGRIDTIKEVPITEIPIDAVPGTIFDKVSRVTVELIVKEKATVPELSFMEELKKL